MFCSEHDGFPAQITKRLEHNRPSARYPASKYPSASPPPARFKSIRAVRRRSLPQRRSNRKIKIHIIAPYQQEEYCAVHLLPGTSSSPPFPFALPSFLCPDTPLSSGKKGCNGKSVFCMSCAFCRAYEQGSF